MFASATIAAVAENTGAGITLRGQSSVALAIENCLHDFAAGWLRPDAAPDEQSVVAARIRCRLISGCMTASRGARDAAAGHALGVPRERDCSICGCACGSAQARVPRLKEAPERTPLLLAVMRGSVTRRFARSGLVFHERHDVLAFRNLKQIADLGGSAG